MLKSPTRKDTQSRNISLADPAAKSSSAPSITDGSLRRVSDLLAPLDHGQKFSLYRMIRDGSLEEMSEPVAQLLVQMLNGRRSEHARRLWTGWFDAVIVRDDGVFKNGVRWSHCVHLADAGAWWLTLSNRMEPEVRRVQDRVAELARNHPLNEIFASAEARIWAEELRVRSLAVLARLRANQAEAAQALSEATNARAQLLKQHGIRQRSGMSRSDLEMFQILLEAAPAWQDCPVQAIHHGDPVRPARDMVQRGDCGTVGAAYFAMAGLHRRNDPASARRLYRAFPLPQVKEAIFERLLFAADALDDALNKAFLDGPSATLALSREAGDHPAARFQEFLAWYDLIHGLELAATDREHGLVHHALRRLINTLHEDCLAVLSRRLLTLTTYSTLEPLIERVQFVNDFRHQLGQRGLVSSGPPWRAEEGRHVAALFRQAAVTGSAESLPLLSRLLELSELLGLPVEITALDVALVSVVEGALRRQGAFEAAEAHLIDKVIETMSRERRRNKWWVSPEALNLLKAAEDAGLETRRDQ
ncbi:hypothetical protein [Azospirillum sp. SYSU D00513]|uniref:hypothetical protein n=1 Tax=Azospirillum sp. SYSU D00513 TaxID=2812561 RepID=UPI001A97C01C|nr:hypothetical protein [Azospirillum sp. SYSU D00513]